MIRPARARESLVTVTIAAVALTVVGEACETFSSGDDSRPATEDASADGASSADTGGADVSADGATDGAVPGDGGLGAIFGPCPPAGDDGGCIATAACSIRTLYVPPAPDAGREYPMQIATDESFVYWITQQAAPGFDAYNTTGIGRVMRVDRDGGAAAALASDLPHALGVALAGDYVYFGVDDVDDAGATTRGNVRRVPRACAPPCAAEQVVDLPTRVFDVVRIDDDGLAVALYDGRTYRVTPSTRATTAIGTTKDYRVLATDGMNVYLGTSQNDPDVYRVAKGTVAPGDLYASIPDGSPKGAFLASDCADLYAFRPGSVLRFPLAGTPPVTIAAAFSVDNAIGAFDLTADGRFLYVAMPNLGGVYAIDKKTGAVRQLVSGNFFRVHADPLGVYWGHHGDESSGAIQMAVK